MSSLNERDISRFLKKPFAVYVADVGDDQPSTPSFYTLPAINLSFNKELVQARAYESCEGILYTVRQDISAFDFRVGFSIQETTLEGIKFTHGGTINSDSDEITLDATLTNKAMWLQSCFDDDSKLIRVIIPKGKSVDSQEVATGESHVIHPNMFNALVDPADKSTFPSIYIEP